MAATSEPMLLALMGGVVILGVIAYGVLGGADFGGGAGTCWPAAGRRTTCARSARPSPGPWARSGRRTTSG